MNDLNLIKSKKVENIINKFCFTIGMLPTSYKLAMTYEEQILCIGKYLEDVVYPAINNNAEALAELQSLFVDLKNFVDNYFENLDVQEEINNKLDEMSQSGELINLITEYLNLKAVFGFNTIEEMSNSTYIQEGSFCKTYGKDELNDGLGQFYKIRTITSSDVVDGYNIVALNTSETLIAEKMKNQEIEDLLSQLNSLDETLTSQINSVNEDLTIAINNVSTELTEEINETNQNLTNLDTKYKTYFNLLSRDNVDFYVDGVNGDDENGGSQTAPFKTFDRFLAEYYKYAELRCHFIGSANTYEMNSIETFNNCGMHLLNESDNANITIDFNGVYTPAFYNSHLNLAGTQEKYITLNIPHNLYFDNCYFICSYAHFTNGTLGNYGSSFELNYPTFENCYLEGRSSISYLRGAIFRGSMNHCCDIEVGSTLALRTSFTNYASISDSLLKGIESSIFIDCGLTNNGSGRGIYSQNTNFIANNSRFNTWNINNSEHLNSTRLGNTYEFLNT